MAAGTVVVVGGGPAGMTAALALRRRGTRVVLVEASADARPAGVGLLLQSPPLRALQSFGLVEDCLAWGYPHATIHLSDADGAEFGVIEPPNVAGPGIPASVAMSRTALQGVLAAAVRGAGVDIRLGTTVTGFDDRGDTVAVWLSDGTEIEADVVVGAEGLHSPTRDAVLPDAPAPRPTGQLSWRVEVPRPAGLDRYLMLHGPTSRSGWCPCRRSACTCGCSPPATDRRPGSGWRRCAAP